jgi:nicotinate-nucleotide--dimethylbenzimidazole phosphoribosyltransferase
MAACVGAIMAARLQRIPVILDGAVAFGAAFVLERLCAGATEHCVLAAPDGLPAGAVLQEALGLPSLLGILSAEADGATGALAAATVITACAAFDGSEKMPKPTTPLVR